MASTPPEPPLSPRSIQVTNTAAQHALNGEDPPFLITVLNELALPVLTNRSQMILEHLLRYYPNPLCHRPSKIILLSRDTMSEATSAAALEVFNTLFPDAFWPEFFKPLLLELNKDDSSLLLLPTLNQLLSQFETHLLSQLKTHFIPEDERPEFTTALLDNLDSGKEYVSERVLSVINILFTDGAEKRFEQSLETLCKKLEQILSSSEVSLEVKEAADEASFGCSLFLKNPVNDEFLQDLLRKLMNTILFNGEINFDVSQEEYARLILDQLVALARAEAWLFINQIDKLVKFMFGIMENPEFEERTRFLAIEFVLALIEGKKGCQILENRGYLHIKRMLSQLSSMIATTNENVALDHFNERDKARLRGMKSMARFSRALGGRFLLEGFPQPFESCFSSEAWQRRGAAISSLSIIAKNCSKALKFKVDLVANPVMKMAEDMHHCVRWEAMYAVEEFSKHLRPEFQNHYHREVLPALTKAMDDFIGSNVEVQAATATYYFVEDCSSNMLEPHLDGIVSKLLRCLQDQFLEYHRTVMPYLTVVMMKAKGESNGMLLSATVACITVARTVGKEKFGDDTPKVVELLFYTPISKLEIHDPLRIEGLNAWGRLRKCLGHEFQPCLEVAIPCLLPSAQLILPDDADIEEPDERMIQIKAETLEEKAIACVLLRDCVAELKEGIDLWVDEVAETLVPHRIGDAAAFGGSMFKPPVGGATIGCGFYDSEGTVGHPPDGFQYSRPEQKLLYNTYPRFMDYDCPFTEKQYRRLINLKC